MTGITKEQFDRLKILRPAIQYTAEEAEFLLEMTKQFVDEDSRVCFDCSNSISELKQKLYGWFTENEPKLLHEITAAEQVAIYTTKTDEK